MEIDKKKGISVDHCHFVFSIPKTLRRYFLYDRSLLSELSRCAWETLRVFFREAVSQKGAVPGVFTARRRGNLMEKGEIASLPAGRQGFARNDNFLNWDLRNGLSLHNSLILIYLIRLHWGG